MTTPNLETVIAESLQSAFEQMFKAAPAIVIDYDATAATATVQPATRRPVADDEGAIVFEAPPVMKNVMVLVPGTQTTTLHTPLAAGDSVLLVWLDYSPAVWRRGGDVSDAGDTHAHGPGYAVAIPWATGWRTNPDTGDSIGRRGAAAARLHFESAFVRAGTGVAFVALASLVQARLDALVAAFNAWTPVPNDGGAALKAALATFVGGSNNVAASNLKADP